MPGQFTTPKPNKPNTMIYTRQAGSNPEGADCFPGRARGRKRGALPCYGECAAAAAVLPLGGCDVLPSFGKRGTEEDGDLVWFRNVGKLVLLMFLGPHMKEI